MKGLTLLLFLCRCSKWFKLDDMRTLEGIDTLSLVFTNTINKNKLDDMRTLEGIDTLSLVFTNTINKNKLDDMRTLEGIDTSIECSH